MSCTHLVFLKLIFCVPTTLSAVPESARWLAMTGQHHKAENILMYMGKKNGIKVTRTMVTLTDRMDDGKEKTSQGALDLFRTPVLRMRMITLMITW